MVSSVYGQTNCMSGMFIFDDDSLIRVYNFDSLIRVYNFDSRSTLANRAVFASSHHSPVRLVCFPLMRASRFRAGRRKLCTCTKVLTQNETSYTLRAPSFDRLSSKLNKYDMCSKLSSCAKTSNFNLGIQIHSQVVKNGHEDNLFIASALVDMYSTCGALFDAHKVFETSQNHDVALWTAMMCGLARNGLGREVLMLFNDMLGMSDVRPNCFTYACVAGVCAFVECTFELASLIHAHVVKVGFTSNCFLTSALVDCYSKCGRVDLAKSLFDAVFERDDVLFNSMISGYSRNGCGEEALRLFVEMISGGFSLTDRTFPSILNACGSSALIENGIQVHNLVIKMGMERNMFAVSALIDMYSKCSAIDKARQVFNETTNKNSVAWTSMVTGYAYSGQGVDALAVFDNMIINGFTPDHISFTSVLVACNHAGLFDRGIEYFDRMRDYGLQPELDQYACLIDLYARNGKLIKAMEIMETMPYSPNAVILTSFLCSCKVHGEVECGKEVAHRLFEMEPNNAAHYLTIASIYSQSGLLSEAAKIRKLMSKKVIRRTGGWTWQ